MSNQFSKAVYQLVQINGNGQNVVVNSAVSLYKLYVLGMVDDECQFRVLVK